MNEKIDMGSFNQMAAPNTKLDEKPSCFIQQRRRSIQLPQASGHWFDFYEFKSYRYIQLDREQADR